MKRQVLQGLAAMLICFFVGGIYIIVSIRQATGQLERAVAIHQAGDLALGLQHNIKLTQADLMLLDTPQGRKTAEIRAHLNSLIDVMEAAQKSRLSKTIQQQFNELRDSAEKYTGQILRIMNLSEGAAEYKKLKSEALTQGEMLTHSVESLVLASGRQLSDHSETIYRDITRVSHLITFLVVVGPIAILIITAFFLKRFTGSIEVLVDASNILKEGNLDYRIKADLKHEFKQLADSFNSMGSSLRKERDDLQAVRRLYQTLFESAGEGIFIIDLAKGREGRIVSANQAAAEMHQYSIDELLTMNIQDVSCDGDCPERMTEALSGNWVQYTVERNKKDGSKFLAAVSVGLLDLGENQYALAFSRDITQQKKEEAELQRANQMALVGEMAAGLAHEIKNPLAGIKVSLEVLSDELTLSDEDQELFTRVINETNRVEKLLKGLLSYARPPKLQYELFDLHRLLDNSIKNISVAGKTSSSQGVEFEKHYAKNLPQLEADSSQLQQIVLNIFLNAIESMTDGGRVTVSTSLHDEESLELRISDTGKGISETDLANIFQPFYTTKTKGTGLGLAICKRIVEEHGGTIEACGNSNGGTTFTIVLPLEQKRQDILI